MPMPSLQLTVFQTPASVSITLHHMAYEAFGCHLFHEMLPCIRDRHCDISMFGAYHIEDHAATIVDLMLYQV